MESADWVGVAVWDPGVWGLGFGARVNGKTPLLSGLDIKQKFNIPVMSVPDYIKLAKKNKEPSKVVLNLGNDGPGTHWVGVKTDKNNHIQYFDSFGVKPPFPIPGRLIY